MPVRRRKDDSIWLAITWMLNVAGVGGIALVAVAYFALKPVFAAPQAESSPLVVNQIFATSTPTLGVYYLPTVTPNPLATRMVIETPTTFVLGGATLPLNIGYSVAGRPIEVYTFGHGAHQRMFVAGIHGGYEWNTIALADELLKYINQNPDVIPDDATLYVLRDLNPDGDARVHDIDGRVNDHGVDLNRNFPTNWSATWNRDGCWNYGPTSGGTYAASEPETRALMGFLQTHKIETLISYHSAALGVFPGGEPWEKKSIAFAKALAKATGYPYPPIETGCKYTGTLADYAVELGAVAVDMELSTHKYTDFNENVKALNILLNWNR